MTLIAGVVGKDGTVYLGGDRAAVTVDRLTSDVLSQPKVWKTEFCGVIGACDSLRMLQVVRYTMDYPVFVLGEKEPMEFLVREFVPALRRAVEKAGLPPDEDGPHLHGNLLIGLSGGLFCVNGDYAVTESTRPYAAIGAGAEIALGALEALRGQPRIAPMSRLYLAMEAAAEHSITVSSPFDVVDTRE